MWVVGVGRRLMMILHGVRAELSGSNFDFTRPRQLPAARDTMVLCAQEMNHLAGILPAVYAAFGGERQTGP